MDCKPIVDVCPQVGSIPASGILRERGVTVAHWPPDPVVRVQILALSSGFVIQRRGGIGNRTGPLNQGAILSRMGSNPIASAKLFCRLWRVSLIGKAVASKATVG